MRMLLSMLKDELGDSVPDEAAHILGILDGKAELLTAMVEWLLEFSRMCSIRPNMVLLDMSTLLHEVYDEQRLAFGCNLFNMGIVPCFLIYPLLKKLLGTKLRIPAAALGGALSMFTGALCEVGEALLSGANGMDVSAFIINMVGIHAAIGVGEGLIIAGLLAAFDKASAHAQRTDRAYRYAWPCSRDERPAVRLRICQSGRP